VTAIAVRNEEDMKHSAKNYLRSHADHAIECQLLARILAFVPMSVQSALNTHNWHWQDLFRSGTLSYLTGRKGIYFGVAQAKTELSHAKALNIAGYVGTAIGQSGLVGRIKNHLSRTYRLRDLASDRPKLFYKYTEGLIDKRRTLTFTVLAYFTFTPDESSKDTRTTLSNLVEATMMILLGTLETGDSSN